MADQLTHELKQRAGELGFIKVGVARAEKLEEEGKKLRQWLNQGFHGNMDYMHRTADVRCDPTHPGMLPQALHVVVLAAPYSTAPHGSFDGVAKVARYARGRDYHNVLYKRGRKLSSWLRGLGHVTRCAVDSMPVLERAWAARAGVGFVGKNCCLIVPGVGSYVFLVALVTAAPLTCDQPMKPRCGSCTACLEGCPTQAFAAAHQLDARRCISYLTIEHRGAIPRSRQKELGNWMFGCDVCQDVCPFNHGSSSTLRAGEVLAEDTEPVPSPTQWLLATEADFSRMARGRAFKRAGRDGMARNAAVVLGNSGDKRHLPVLSDAAHSHASHAVRDAANEACRRLSD